MFGNRTTHSKFSKRSAAMIAGIVVLGLGAGNVAAAQANSTMVHLNNKTGCNLLRVAFWGQGTIAINPNSSIPAGTSDYWKTQSANDFTGTEGHSRYVTNSCTNTGLNSRFVEVHWDNPKVGANSYDYLGTSSPFIVPHTGGAGINADVVFYAQL